MSIKNVFNKSKSLLSGLQNDTASSKTSSTIQKHTRKLSNGNSASSVKLKSGPIDQFSLSKKNTVSQSMQHMKHLKQRREAIKRKQKSGYTPGAGNFWDARANSKEMHRIADQMVDKHGALSAQALSARSAAVMYDYSIAGAAQEAGEAFGNPNSSVSDKARSAANIGIHLLDTTPIPNAKTMKSVKNFPSAKKALRVFSRGAGKGTRVGKVFSPALSVGGLDVLR